jgi:hypothetical protein
VAFSVTTVAPGAELGALAEVIARAKGDDRLAPVTVVVPTNTCGVMARRALGRSSGIAGVDMVTLTRLAELIAGPELAAAGRTPSSTPVIDLAIRSVLRRDPGPYRSVAAHPSTIVALRRAHAELRLAGPDATEILAAGSGRGGHVVRVSEAVTAELADHWYDEADLLDLATDSVTRTVPAGLRRLVVHLPEELAGRARAFLRALAASIPVDLVVSMVGDTTVDRDTIGLLDALGLEAPPASTASTGRRPDPTPVVVSTTDADDEVRIAVRAVLDAAREGTPFERIALLWPTHQPYARLVEHHLDNADITWNGRPGTSVTERLAPRLVLDLLDVDRRGLRRRSLFELLADVPARGPDGEHVPTASWERVSREAGVARDDDWHRRLGALTTHDHWGDAATSLRAFVDDLRTELGPPAATRRWWDWADWCARQLDRWLGRATLDRLPDPEYRAWEALTRALDRLRHLDPVGGPVTRHQFRTTLEAELDEAPLRRGRVGDGVTVGPLAGAVGLDVDLTVVVGAAEGLLPPTPTADPLLSDADRERAGLSTSDARAVRLQRQLLARVAAGRVVLTFPRGDLRATSAVEPSRWVRSWTTDDGATVRTVASHHAGLLETSFPTSPTEHRLRGRLRAVRAGVEPMALAAGDERMTRDLACLQARASDELTEYDGDLSGARVPVLDHPVSPSRLEAWSSCPHGYLVRYLLRVRPVDEPDTELSITAIERGSAHHDALDRLHSAVVAGDLPQPTTTGWTDVHREALIGHFDDVCESAERRGRTGRPAFWADERARMLADLLAWLDVDSRFVVGRGATILASEHRFGGDDAALRLPDGRSLALEGSIDRVDRSADGRLVVTDHKSGRNRYAKLGADDPTLGGTLFQLPAYAAAARSSFGPPDVGVIAEYGLLARGDYARPGLVIDHEVDRLVAEQVAAVVDGIESGWFPNRPERPGWRLFVPCEYCEPDHLGTADRWGEWERKRHDPRLARWFGDDASPGGTGADAPDTSRPDTGGSGAGTSP